MTTKAIPIVDYLVLADPPYLEANACDACGALYFDRRNGCSSCEARTFTRRPLATHGTLRSFSIVHRSAPGIPSPYTSALVALEGGGIVKANLHGLDNDPARIRLGMALRMITYPVGTDDDGTEAVAFGFEPVETP